MNRLVPSARLTAGILFGVAAGRLSASSQVRFARQLGSSIAGRDAAGWVTDFLNAAYYRRPEAEREVADLRLASSILTTRWHETGGRRLHAHDVVAFHRAFGHRRFLDRFSGPVGTLDGAALLEGAVDLLGDWFPDAYADAARRGWGIAFRSVADRASYEPESRLRLARLGALTPGSGPPSEQTWHTYSPVPVSSAEDVAAALGAPETWPDYASELGRFTPLRTGGLANQTFEIEVVAGASSGRPIFLRGYVTITQVVSKGDGQIEAYIAALEDGLTRYGRGLEPRAVPEGATPLVAFDLTTHEHHFMGRGHNRLLVYEQEGQTWLRAVGTWDRMPWHLRQGYEREGRDAQSAFWGHSSDVRKSMLHQLALSVEQ